ncbi:MAG: ferrous iron transport protein A [Candidatus Omnitrophica bacterium]|nr:ferrous iron transport protein A [Candidatus Omnitrophota bacterium]
MKRMYLTELKRGQTAVVMDILGGMGAERRLEALGIRRGKKLTMISAHFWRGPVTVLIGKAKVAIGHGMAQKILVEVL